MSPHSSEPTGVAGYVAGLDGIRGLAIGLVLFSHSVIYDQFSGVSDNGLNAGYTGVAIFFVLSGYLITRLLLREEDRTGSISLSLFYLRRALRLFPALWLYLAVVFGLWLRGSIPDHPLHSFATSLLYVRNLVGRGHETDHLWSLSLEEQFYLLWPLVLVGLPRRDRRRFVIAVAFLMAVTGWRIYAARHGLASAGALYIRSDFRFDGPLFGCALALAERIAPKWVSSFNGTALRSGVLLLLALVSLGLWIALRLNNRLFPGTDSTVACLLGGMFVVSQVGANGKISSLLSWAPLVGLGRISYGVYVWQQLFLGPRVGIFAGVRAFPLGLFSTLMVAMLSFVALERPILRFKDSHLRKVTPSA